ncbi:MAG: amino acid adenylation domain-containing protein [Nitrospiraceae bacterium]|nr:amino acid adenylation domain-containing protein [Nitrospiraceae bacterium]
MKYLLHHVLINSARRYPDKDAVICAKERTTYRELDETSSKLAWVLQENGVKRGDRVGVYLDKSIQSVAGIYGILKAGGVYVPVDPRSPSARTAYIIKDCGIKCILSSAAKSGTLTQAFPEGSPLDLAVLADKISGPHKPFPAGKVVPWQEVAERAETAAPENKSIDTDLAYIFYTSGSTGRPKGVMLSHLNALSFVNLATGEFGITSEDRFSNHAPLHFDISTFDLFVSFNAGATLVLVPDEVSSFPIALADWIRENGISIWYSVPSVLSLLVLHGKLERHKFPKLRTVVFAGEPFPVKYLRRLMELVPNPEYYNLYGSTEANVISLCRIGKAPDEHSKSVHIGKTCANMEMLVLTPEGKPVTEPGEVGEICARGSLIAQGYWGDAEKTGRAFVTDPARPFQDRMYRTGDLATIDEKGNYILLGRRDHMIKSRGYRVEPGEVEAVLYSHPEVKEAAVIGLPHEVMGNLIKAFVTFHRQNGLTPADMRTYCAERVPKYMVPEIIEFRETLPRTSTGKIDKTELGKE